MQTIGKIINGKYVRYGAVSVGDKLGDAAFANIVNNSSTTEEGFVPDARVVAQQQQLITQQQAQIDSLNSAIGKNGKSLYSAALGFNANNVNIPEFGKYTFFVCMLNSSYNSGVAIGIRFSPNHVRFVGMSRSASGVVSSYIAVNTSAENHDIITAVSGTPGEQVTGISQIYGVF